MSKNESLDPSTEKFLEISNRWVNITIARIMAQYLREEYEAWKTIAINLKWEYDLMSENSWPSWELKHMRTRWIEADEETFTLMKTGHYLNSIITADNKAFVSKVRDAKKSDSGRIMLIYTHQTEFRNSAD